MNLIGRYGKAKDFHFRHDFANILLVYRYLKKASLIFLLSYSNTILAVHVFPPLEVSYIYALSFLHLSYVRNSNNL